MPQIRYKANSAVDLPVPDPAAKIQVPIPDSRDYLGFSIQIIDAQCVSGEDGDQGFNVEVSLDGVNWGLLYSADLYSDQPNPHVHKDQVITFSLRAPARGGVRLVSRANMTTAGKAVVSLYERAFPPQV